jgi:hypothetical protein
MRRGARTPGGAASPAGDAKASGDRDSEGSVTGKRFADGPGPIPGEEEPGRPDPSPGRRIPGGGKAQGRNGRQGSFGFRAATDFRGDQSPEGERGAPRGIAKAPIEPTPGGQARPRGVRPCRGRGNLRRVQSQERSLSETRRERFREEQGVRRVQTLKAQRNPGEAIPGRVASRHRTCCREQNPGEAQAAAAAGNSGPVRLRNGAEGRRGARRSLNTNVVTAGA